jgi:dephospho-CoA kinase
MHGQQNIKKKVFGEFEYCCHIEITVLFNRAQDTRSWKLLQVAVPKYTVHTRLKTRSSMTVIFNLLYLVGTMSKAVLAKVTGSEVNITSKNMHVMTSAQIMKLQHVQ